MTTAQTDNLAELCRRHNVRRLALFGSYARGDATPPTSDRDFAVEFEPLSPVAHKTAYFGLLAGLEALFGCPIDLVERSAIRNPYVRARVEREAVDVYAAAA